MTDGELLSTILDGAERLSKLSRPEQERALAELRASAERVAIATGVTEADGRRLAEELVEVLRATSGASPPPERVLH